MNKLHTVYTAHYRYSGSDRTDITVKGQHPEGKLFAPTWDMVMGVKKGTVTEDKYVELYLDILKNKVPVSAWNWLLSEPVRTLVCFCPKDAFCHRNILVNYLIQILGIRITNGGFHTHPDILA